MPNVRQRGRPLSFDQGAALDRILPVFWRKGLDGASLDELAAAAGLNRPNLTTAFGDKRGLYQASLSRYREQFVARATAALESSDSLNACLECFFETAIEIYTSDSLGCLIFRTAPASAGNDPEMQTALRRTL